MPTTASRHFFDDINRASALVDLADPMPSGTDAEQLIRDDILRSAWMFAVGALDAYFCDAYISLLSRTMRAKSLQKSVKLPEFVRHVTIPIGAVLQSYTRENWRWRMAVRQMMDKDNVLQLARVRQLFNPFLPPGRKLFTEIIEAWITHADGTARVFGITSATYNALSPNRRGDARKRAAERMQKRVKSIIQRRHDCIHNCDRPKVSPQPIGRPGTVRNVIRDVTFLVARCNDHIDSEFMDFLDRIGCSGVTRNALRV